MVGEAQGVGTAASALLISPDGQVAGLEKDGGHEWIDRLEGAQLLLFGRLFTSDAAVIVLTGICLAGPLEKLFTTLVWVFEAGTRISSLVSIRLLRLFADNPPSKRDRPPQLQAFCWKVHLFIPCNAL